MESYERVILALECSHMDMRLWRGGRVQISCCSAALNDYLYSQTNVTSSSRSHSLCGDPGQTAWLHLAVWPVTQHVTRCSLLRIKPQCDVTPLFSPLWALRDVPLLPSVTTPRAKTVKLFYREHFFIWFYDIEDIKGTFLIVWSTSYT